MVPPEVAEKLNSCDNIVGSDECGYGSWAGPLVVCAVLVSRGWPGAKEVKDSKVLTAARRQDLFLRLKDTLHYALASASSTRIDELGVWRALHKAHETAIKNVVAAHEADGCVGSTVIIVDGNLQIPGGIALPKADALVPAVSMASIIAKVARDRMMVALDAKHPGYGFGEHKGYGTPAHQEALNKLGPCPEHRTSYAPIAKILADREDAGQLKNAWELLDDC
jgi:ribonuclease HII